MYKVFTLILCFVIVKIQTEFVPPDFEEVTEKQMGDIVALEKCGQGSQRGLFHCVSYHRCDPVTNTTIPEEDIKKQDEDEEFNTDYSIEINIRLGAPRACKKVLDKCCKIGDNQPQTTSSPLPLPSPSPNPSSTPSTKPVNSRCGIRNSKGIGFQLVGNTHNEAEYGEFPWMVAVVKKDYNPREDEAFSVCGGSLIAPRVVLTGAHCVQQYQASELKVRAGEWDAKTTDEQYPYQEQDVGQIILHENFKSKGVLNDVALLLLKAPFKKARHIGTICLPDQNEVINSKECYATGWGKNVFGSAGEYQLILKKIDIPTVPRNECEKTLQSERLGNRFRLHESFMCAGGIVGKDTCTGDGGSPLVCPDPKNPSRYVQVGIVAWGLGCGTKSPGVYADVAKFRNWVDGQMQKLNLSPAPYRLD